MGTYSYHDFLAMMGFGGAHPGGLTLTKELVKDMPLSKNSSVLDAGCGTGQSAAYLVEVFGCHVTAVDSHPIMIEKAKQRFETLNLQVDLLYENIESLPIEDESFDFILVESVTVFTDIERTIGEYARVLRPGGMLIDLEMTAAHPFSQAMLQPFAKLYDINEIPTAGEWKNKFLQTGFRNVKVSDNKVIEAINDETLQGEIDVNPSQSINPNIFEIWDEHQFLTENYADHLLYTVYYVKK